MADSSYFKGPNKDPIAALANSPEAGVLAVIIRIDGPSYRPVGAIMAIFAGGARVGTLSSGCIESDLVLHAEKALKNERPETVLYGRGSPYIDIQLPCGGGLEILLLPRPDRAVLRALSARQAQRIPSTLTIAGDNGQIGLSEHGETGPDGALFRIRMLPDIMFYVFGKGPEASTFAALVQSAGYPNLLLSPDRETLDFGTSNGCDTAHLTKPGFPAALAPDPWSAIVLFFHDHEWEPPILQSALATPAFYIGSQGSKRARDTRLEALAAMGVSAGARARLHGPIGLIPSARDARTLAISVLGEVLADAAGKIR